MNLPCHILITGLSVVIWAPQPSTSETNNKNVDVWDTRWGPEPQNVTDFTYFLWYRFSSNKVNFTREDFKTFVECTTGRRNCPLINKERPVSLLTDCSINNALTAAECNIVKKCSSSDDLLEAHGVESENMDIDELRALLPSVVYQSQMRQNCEETVKDPVKAPGSKKKPKPAEVWGYGMLFVTVISGCSLAGVSVIPLMAHTFYQQLLTMLVGLAVGSLAASSLFHLIPQALHIGADKDGNHDYLFISLFVLLGTWGFFMIERIIKINISQQSQKDQETGLPTTRSDQQLLYINGCEVQANNHKPVPVDVPQKVPDTTKTQNQSAPEEPQTPNGCSPKDVQLIYASQEQAIKASFGHNERPQSHSHNHNIEFRQGEDSVIRTVAWMIIFGDGFHNFIDGVSIGAAFSESILTGVSISLAVLCEELPHELGDFAVLLNAGMTMKQAVAYNFLSATTCYVGLITGIVLGEFTQNTTAIFALAAGMFLYIALVDMVPEMNEVAGKAAEQGWKSALIVLFLQNIGMFLGVLLLFVLAYFQDSMLIE